MPYGTATERFVGVLKQFLTIARDYAMRLVLFLIMLKKGISKCKFGLLEQIVDCTRIGGLYTNCIDQIWLKPEFSSPPRELTYLKKAVLFCRLK